MDVWCIFPERRHGIISHHVSQVKRKILAHQAKLFAHMCIMHSLGPLVDKHCEFTLERISLANRDKHIQRTYVYRTRSVNNSSMNRQNVLDDWRVMHNPKWHLCHACDLKIHVSYNGRKYLPSAKSQLATTQTHYPLSLSPCCLTLVPTSIFVC